MKLKFTIINFGWCVICKYFIKCSLCNEYLLRDLQTFVVLAVEYGTVAATCLFTRLVESSLVPAGFLSVSAGNVSYDAFVLMWEFGGFACYCLPGVSGKHWKAN